MNLENLNVQELNTEERNVERASTWTHCPCSWKISNLNYTIIMKTINTKNKKRYKVGFKIVLLTGALYMFLTYYTHNKHHKTKVNNLQEVTTDELKPLF